jgi:Transposase DDE domain
LSPLPSGRACGRPRKHPVPSTQSQSAQAVLASLPEAAWRTVSWRRGSKGALRAEFAALRVRVADGPIMSGAQHLPGAAAWLVGERRASGERKYYLANHAEDVGLESLAALIKARWVCEQAHQQMKEELGLDHFEGRSWPGLHHHVLMTMLALAFLQHLRLGGKNRDRHGTAAAAICAAGAPSPRRRPEPVPAALPALSAARALSSPPIILAE